MPSAEETSRTSADEVWPRIAAATSERWRGQLHMWWTWLTGDGVLVHEGDLDAADLVIGPEPLVVTGNVRVTGLIEDRHRADHTLLVILGDLDAGNVATFSAIFVAGQARVGGVLYGFSSGHDTFCVAGGLSARAVAAEHHHVEVHGTVDVDVLVAGTFIAETGPRTVLEPHDALVKGAYTVSLREAGRVLDSTVDNAGLLRRLRAGRPVLADTRLSPADKAITAVRDKAEQATRPTRLSLDSMGLSSVPAQVFELTWLQRLVLSDNPLTVIPPEIGHLRTLRRLDLELLPITGLPDELCRLPALTTMSLRYCNRLTTLPDSFANLAALEQLYLDGATLTNGFPDVLTRLPKLRKLWWWKVSDNRLPAGSVAALIDGISRMPALTQTGFFQSRLDTLPDDLSPLATLRRVWLANDVTIPDRELLRLQQALPPGRLRQGHPR